uniref:F-box protein 42 n=1 Tax=Petromyzon marinus TaxID=7757 RepID=S4R6X4_PETMA
QVGDCVVVFSQAPSGKAPLSPSLHSRPSPISTSPPAVPAPIRLGDHKSQSPRRSPREPEEEAQCVNGRWGTLRPRAQRSQPRHAADGSAAATARFGGSAFASANNMGPKMMFGRGRTESTNHMSKRISPSRMSSLGSEGRFSMDMVGRSSTTLSAETKGLSADVLSAALRSVGTSVSVADKSGSVGECAAHNDRMESGVNVNGSASAVAAAASVAATHSPTEDEMAPAASSTDAEAAEAESATGPIQSSAPGGGGGGTSRSFQNLAQRLGAPRHHPHSLSLGKPLYQSLNCKPMRMYVLEVSARSSRRVAWKGLSCRSVVGPPETSLHTVVRGRGELIIFGGLVDRKQNVKYYPKTNALYFVRAKR